MHEAWSGVMQVAAMQVALGLLDRVRDIDDAANTDSLTRWRRPFLVLALEIGVDHGAHLIRRRVPGHQRQETLLRRKLDGRVGARAGDADLDIGQWLRDDVPALALPELSLPVERLRRASCFADQFDRFAHHGTWITGDRPALIVPGDVHADTETGHVAAVREMVADRSLGRYLQ